MKTIKIFDCVAMKRRIQENIHRQTGHMNHAELRKYVRERIETSRFREYFEKPQSL